MKIELHEKERLSLECFADKHGLIMEIHERGRRVNTQARFYAHFKGCEVKDGGVLIGVYGNGTTPDTAMADYADQISDVLLVVDSYTDQRREIYTPILTFEKAMGLGK